MFGGAIGTERGEMLYPTECTSPMPHPDLPESCLTDYEEAREIAEVSPRGAAALLRLCIQKLCKAVGQPGVNINDDIAALVKGGLSQQIQQALDVVRVVGNNAVHPGVMTLDDHADHVRTMFESVNIIVEQLITQPKKIAAVYSSLPDRARKAIERRDSKTTQP
jgi:hypothetical protein